MKNKHKYVVLDGIVEQVEVIGSDFEYGDNYEIRTKEEYVWEVSGNSLYNDEETCRIENRKLLIGKLNKL